MDAAPTPEIQRNDYRQLLKARLKSLSASNSAQPRLTWKRIASLLPIQYTYLSKALNDADTHLSEEHLFQICQCLRLSDHETKRVLTLRALSVSRSSGHRDFLERQLQDLSIQGPQHIESRTLDAPAIRDEIAYLLNPTHIILYVALAIAEYRHRPHLLAGPLGLTPLQLRESLRLLARMGLIDLDEKGWIVEARNSQRQHLASDHILVRYHQNMLRNLVSSRVMQTAEREKKNFLATFTMDDDGFEQTKVLFSKFIQQVEEVARSRPDQGVYQLCFDLFRWL
jgi:hypothetical protein